MNAKIQLTNVKQSVDDKSYIERRQSPISIEINLIVTMVTSILEKNKKKCLIKRETDKK